MFHKQRLKFVWVFLLLVVFFCLLAAFLWNVSQPGKTVEGCPKGCAREVERHPGPLRVVSLNMLHGYPDFENLSLRLDLIASEIHRLDADVVLLQETPWTRMRGNAAEYLARKLGYNYLYFRANGNHRLIFFEEGEAILSRFRLEDPHFTVLPPRAGLLENRITLGANALTPMGDVTFFVTHLTDKNLQANYNQAESLRDFVEGNVKGLTVIAGDFNAQEDTQQITELAGNWTDAYRNAHPNDPGLTCCIDDLASGPGEPLEKRIDYIFLVSGKEKNEGIISVQQVFDRPFPAGNGWQWASDHTGLLVELEP